MTNARCLTQSDERLTLGWPAGVCVPTAHFSRGVERVTEVAYPGRVAVAVLAIAAAMIRFSSVPEHAAHGAGGATAVALAGWVGVVVAVAVMLRASRDVLAVALAAFSAIIV